MRTLKPPAGSAEPVAFEDGLLAELLGVHAELRKEARRARRRQAVATFARRHAVLRRPRNRWALGGLAGAAVAVIVLAGLGIFSTAPRLNASSVVYHTTGAVTSADNDVAYAHLVETGATGAVLGTYDWWSYSSPNEFGQRIEELAADGSPLTDSSWSVSNGVAGNSGTPEGSGGGSGVVVDYTNRTWHESPTAPELPFSGISGFTAQLALGHVVEHQLSGGNFTNVEQTTLDGQPALELSGTVEVFQAVATKTPASANSVADATPSGTSGSAPGALHQAKAVAAGNVALSGTKLEWTVWVDPATYLPIQMLEVSPDGTTVESSIEWLVPTTASLAQLIAPIPTGFTEVASSTPPTGNSGS